MSKQKRTSREHSLRFFRKKFDDAPPHLNPKDFRCSVDDFGSGSFGGFSEIPLVAGYPATAGNIPLPVSEGKLRNMQTGEIVPITGQVFHIGRDPNYADYAIRDDKLVSRSHAVILTENGKHLVIDNGARNPILVNGNVVPPKGEREIRTGDILRFGRTDFVFIE